MPSDLRSSSGLLLIHAGAVADPSGPFTSKASLLLDTSERRATVLATGPRHEVERHPAARNAIVRSLPNSVVFPALVNAHTHLDLTHIGPRDFDPARGFGSFVDLVRTERAVEDAHIAASVSRGLDLLLAGGTGAVGDIAGAPRGIPSLVPLRVLNSRAMPGVSFIEFFAIGKGEHGGLSRMLGALDSPDCAAGCAQPGLQPHATNTVSLGAFDRAVNEAAARGLRLSTHLAETPEEREFIAHASGPQRELLERLGVWSDDILRDIGRGKTPVAHMSDVLRRAPFVVAHVNDASDADIELLANSGATVVYCPRASAYFQQERAFGPHRYLDMIRAGVPVALGTDSIINLPTPDRISVLDEMRFLHARDGAAPDLLLRLATLNGAAALGLDPTCVSLAQGASPLAIVAVDVGAQRDWARDPLGAVMKASSPPTWVWRPE